MHQMIKFSIGTKINDLFESHKSANTNKKKINDQNIISLEKIHEVHTNYTQKRFVVLKTDGAKICSQKSIQTQLKS